VLVVGATNQKVAIHCSFDQTEMPSVVI